MRARDTSLLRGRVKTLWIVAGAVAAVLVMVVVVTAFRDRSRPLRGEDTAAYIVRVNTLQSAATRSLVRVNAAYAGFTTAHGGSPAQQRRLASAARELRALRARIARVRAPQKAIPLRAQLLRLFDLQVAFARDVTLFAAYLPGATSAERQVETARVSLLHELRAAKDPDAQAGAFDAYAAAVGAAARRLAALRAPAEFDRARRSETARLNRLSTVAAETARALRARRRADVESALRTFARASASNVAALRQREAVIAYNARLRAVEAQRAKVEREQLRLQKSL